MDEPQRMDQSCTYNCSISVMTDNNYNEVICYGEMLPYSLNIRS